MGSSKLHGIQAKSASRGSNRPRENTAVRASHPHGPTGEGFRFPLFGGHITIDLWGQDIFEDPHLHGFRFRYEMDPARIDIRSNSLISRWEDWEELIARGTLVAFEGSSSVDSSHDVRKILQAKVTADKNFGAAIRWGIQAREPSELWLVIQFLPRSAGYLKKEPRLTSEICGAMEIAAMKLSTSIQLEDPGRGPIPTLFSRDVEATSEVLSDDPDLLHPGTGFF